MVVAVKIGPDGRIGVEIFAAVYVAQHRALAGNDDQRLAPQPVAHLRERMPDVPVIKFGKTVHLNFDLRFAIYEFVQSGGEPVDFFGCVTRRQRYAQPRLAPGDGRMPDGRNENSPFAQSGGGLDRFLFIAD